MIFSKASQKEIIRKAAGGSGQGELHGLYAIPPGDRSLPTCFRMLGRATLQPGHSVGFHPHTEDEEIYCILSGTGLYTDTDGSTHQLVAGDFTLTLKGQSHSLLNNGTEPLVFLAIIAAG